MIELDFKKVLFIGSNRCIRQWSQETVLLYSKTLPKEKIDLILKSNFKFYALDKTGLEISKKFYKKYNINTLLIKLDEETTLL